MPVDLQDNSLSQKAGMLRLNLPFALSGLFMHTPPISANLPSFIAWLLAYDSTSKHKVMLANHYLKESFPVQVQIL